MTHKGFLILVLGWGISLPASAQYYYKDIVTKQQAAEEMQAWKEQKIRTIKVHSFEANKEPSEGFFCEKQISRDYRTVETYTRTYNSSKSLLTSYYNKAGQLIQSRDSSELNVTVSDYQYNAAGKITAIVSSSSSSDDDFQTVLKEEHQYKYNEQNRPVQMLKIKNDRDSTLIDFLLDEKGNVTDEIEPGKDGKHYYYYYDSKNRLTDIVKYHILLKKLLPDFSFEYNSANQVTQMIVVEDGVTRFTKDPRVFTTWKYFYSGGLRIIEKCYDNEGSLLGYIEYEY